MSVNLAEYSAWLRVEKMLKERGWTREFLVASMDQLLLEDHKKSFEHRLLRRLGHKCVYDYITMED